VIKEKELENMTSDQIINLANKYYKLDLISKSIETQLHLASIIDKEPEMNQEIFNKLFDALISFKTLVRDDYNIVLEHMRNS
jgi:hypothetical protein